MLTPESTIEVAWPESGPQVGGVGAEDQEQALTSLVAGHKDRLLIRLGWMWGFGEQLVLSALDVPQSARFYLAGETYTVKLLAATRSPSAETDRALLDWVFETAGDDFEIRIANAPSELSLGEGFTRPDAIRWLWQACERYPALWEETLQGHLDDAEGWGGWPASTPLPARPTPEISAVAEAEALARIEEGEHEASGTWGKVARSARIKAKLESWRREHDPTYAQNIRAFEIEVERAQQAAVRRSAEVAPAYRRHLIERFVTEYLGLPDS
jgi:hypothetical protein